MSAYFTLYPFPLLYPHHLDSSLVFPPPSFALCLPHEMPFFFLFHRGRLFSWISSLGLALFLRSACNLHSHFGTLNFRFRQVFEQIRKDTIPFRSTISNSLKPNHFLIFFRYHNIMKAGGRQNISDFKRHNFYGILFSYHRFGCSCDQWYISHGCLIRGP